MLISFNDLPSHSRIWVFQSSKVFSEIQIVDLKKKIETFLEKWTSHGHSFETGYKLPYKRFVVIGLNESSQSASGCSIDKCMNFIKSLESVYDVDLLDKMNVTFRNKNLIEYVNLKEFIKLAKSKLVSLDTIVFNNLVLNKDEFVENWEVRAKDSWHKRFMKF
tara:strand:+ start:128 stop:616 length:489 start_codon:yes stop_codon:yes gene_type:complete